MATTTEYTGVFTQVDDEGNENLLYPKVKTDATLSVAGEPADAAAVGSMMTRLGTMTISSGSESYTIENTAIKENSIIDIYYAQDSLETLSNAGGMASWSQIEGSATITFGAALEADATIETVLIINVEAVS